MVERLKYEVELPAEAPAAPAAGGVAMQAEGSGAAAAAAAPAAVDAPAAGAGAPATADAAAQQAQQRTVPYSRRLLLKSLLRAIAIASYSPGGVRADDRDAAELYGCLKTIFGRRWAGACWACSTG